ncbi:matrix-remodeling-associated protein 5 [Spea bombifrons]|uniref:matrix-remodeling-associated protein 5 n=1 Tax=Spea bombifrons TaxID=233779 RepID=UPI00234A29D3|nr:matrix-remodeling-associated protein 5 [Spea bombifrons]
MKALIKMDKTYVWIVFIIIIFLGIPQNAFSCPHPCACYVNSEVHCTFRSLAAVPTRIPKHVERINLGFNSIQFIAEDAFAGLSKLEMLLIHSNDVHNIPNGAFRDLASLQVFKLSYNKLKVITSHTFHGLSSLTRLHVDHNKIEFIHPNAFNGLTSLRLLHLEGNMIQQLHANTFCTFNFLDYFRESTIKHLYLSDNLIQTLPAAMIQTMPLLENLYLHGNPWICDCRLKWLLEWDEQSNGVLKCKKDRSYENGQLCAMCSSPKQLQNQEIQSLKDVACSSPVIYSPYRVNSSDLFTEDDGADLQMVQSYKDYIGKVILNMTDEHGNKVNLECEMKKSSDFSKINWNQPHPEEIDVNATFSLDFECPMNRENYEKLWKLIAYYSEVPVKMERELMFTGSPKVTYRYRQNADQDSYYYTGVKSLISAEPEWVIQPFVSIQLNRKMSTAKKVTLSFSTQFSQLIHTKEIQHPKNNWVMIDRNSKTKTSQIVVKGEVCQLSCNVRSSESPTIQWGLPDGTILKAPYNNLDDRYSVSAGGQLVIKAVDLMDSGLYHCVAQVKHGIDVLTFRVVVQPPTSEISEQNTQVITQALGEPITLTCNAIANPDAEVNWILPDNTIIDSVANKTNVHLLSNGSLVIPHSKQSDSGLYVCIAANEHGTDHYSVQLTLNRKVSVQSYPIPIIRKRPIVKIPVKPNYNVIDDDGGSGEKEAQEEPEKYNKYVKVGSGKNKGSRVSKVTNKEKTRKDRMKLKVLKNTERSKGSSIAEGRRKFESRRRINMGNKQIDPHQWANILAKVRGKNVQRTTEVPRITSTEATTIPTHFTKSTTPSTIARPPVKPMAGAQSNVDETSADEEELLSQVTKTPNNYNVASSADHIDSAITRDETEYYSENTFSENNEERVSTESSSSLAVFTTSMPVMSTLENIDINDLAYSTDEDEISRSFIELEDSTHTADKVLPTKDLAEEHSTRTAQYEQYTEEQFSEAENTTFLKEDDIKNDLNEMEISSGEMFMIPKEEQTEYFPVRTSTTTSSQEQFSHKDTETMETEEIHDKSSNKDMQHLQIVNTEIIPSDMPILWTEESHTLPSTTSKPQTSVADYDEVSKAMGGIVPKYVIVSPPTAPNVDYIVPTLTSSILAPTESLAIGLNEEKHPEDYVEQTKNVYTDVKETVAVNTETPKTSKITETTPKTSKITETTPTFGYSVKTDANLLTSTIAIHPISSTSKKEMVTTLPTKIATVHVPTQTPTTASSLLTNGNINYPRRRPNGRRRFRPNRFRQRQNQIVPMVPPTTQVRISTLFKKPQVSFSEGVSTTGIPSFTTQVNVEPLYKTTNDITSKTMATTMKAEPITVQMDRSSSADYRTTIDVQTKAMATTTTAEPIIMQTVRSSNTNYKTINNVQSKTMATATAEPIIMQKERLTSTPEYIPPSYSTMTTTSVPLLVAPVTTTNTLKTYSTEKADNLNVFKTLQEYVNTMATKVSEFQTSTFHDTVSSSVINNNVQTNIEPSQPYKEYSTGIPEDNVIFPTAATGADEASDIEETLVTATIASAIKSSVSVEPIRTTIASLLNTAKPTSNVFMEKYSSEDVYKDDKEGIGKPVSHTVRNELLESMGVFPLTKKNVVPTTLFHLTSSSAKPFFIPYMTPKTTKVSEITNQVAPTQGTKIMQPNIPSSRRDELERFPPSKKNMSVHPQQEQFKDIHGTKSNSTVPHYTKLHSQSQINHNQHHAVQQTPYNTARVTMRSPYFGTHSPLRHFITNPPIHQTNKPEITAYTVQNVQERKTYAPLLYTTTPATSTTTAVPLSRPRPMTPSKYNLGQRISTIYRPFGNNVFTDSKVNGARIPYYGHPYYLNPRFLYRFNRTRPVQFVVTSKPPIPTSGESVNKNNPINAFARTTTSSAMLKTTSSPTTATRTTTTSKIPPTNPIHTTVPPYFGVTRFLKPSSTTQSYWYNLHAIQKPPIASSIEDSKLKHPNEIQPSLNIRSQASKPKITTTGFQSISVPYEMDAILPCEANGEPKPSISWTKVSTGAIMTVNTRIQRFEVLQNGTLHIQNLQLQDRGQYLCTAHNQLGLDRMLITLTVVAQQPKMLSSRYKDVTVYLGDTVTMDCHANGVPSPHISWIFPDRKIIRAISTTESRVMLYENGTLSIKDTTFSDRGIFKCVASNVAGADSVTVRVHVAALPPIIQQEKVENISLPQGHSIYIHCSAKGAPPPSIRWVLLDGTQVRPSQLANGNLFVFPNGTLYIRNILQKDIGRYECIAANIVGAAKRTVVLDVKKYPLNAKITGSSPQRTDVTYGGTLRLDCSAAGDPWPRILWRLPSKRLVDSFFSFDSRIKTFSNGTLIVYSVTDKDAGDYLCMARNKLGDDYVVLKVNVMMKPAKIQQKKEVDHKVMYGGDLKVDCVATGVPNPEISWSLPDGSMINNVMQSDDSGSRTRRYGVFNNGTLYFNEVGMKEEGDYTCYAVNQIGKDEMRVSVKVVAERAIIKNKTYSVVNVPYGDVVTVSCEAKGEPVPKITWLTPANKPIPALSDKYQIYRDGTLLIQKVQRSDSGNYTCVAQNSGGEDKKIVQIQVNVLSPQINGYSNKITAIQETAAKDSHMLIDCKAEGIPTPRVMWVFPEGVILPAPYYGNRITVHRNGTLEIKGLRKTDSVQLTCIARNEGGEAKLSVQLTVTEPAEKPKFINDNENIVVAEGQAVNLNCSATGRPEPETQWILPNGTVVRSGSHLHRIFHKRDGTLHIGFPSMADAGAYRCRAVNVAGYADKMVNLQIGRKPQLSNHYNNLISIINGETLQLQCTTQGEPKPRIAWTLPNGMVIDGPQVKDRVSLLQNGTLVVRNTSVYDRGSYICKATTQYGSSTMSVPVIVIAYPPRITTSPAPVIYARPGGSVQLNCMSIGIPKAEISWELPDKSHLTALAQSRLYGNKFLHPQGTLIIQHISKRDMGYYKCTAKNILGSDTKTTYIHIY